MLPSPGKPYSKTIKDTTFADADASLVESQRLHRSFHYVTYLPVYTA
jgi:hypothetical protein